MRIVGPAYLVVAFLGRLPLAMSQLGTLVVVSQATGSYGLGGTAAGALAVANAVGSPIAGALADSRGQRWIVLAQSLGGAVGLLAIVTVTNSGASAGAILGTAAITGFVLPQVGPLARVRWRPITADQEHRDSLIDAAFSLEGAIDELSFVLGPAAVGILAVVLGPTEALVVAALTLAVFGSLFALHRTAALVGGTPRVVRQVGDARLWTVAFAILMLAQWCVGLIFGSSQTGTTALATAAGYPDAAGLIHAVLGVGSVLAAIFVTMLPATVLYGTRMLVASIALAVFSVPLLLVDSIPALTSVMAVLGFAVAPYMISNFALAGLVVPNRSVGTAMTFLAAATGLGYACGAAAAGNLADSGGHTHAFAVTVVASVVAVLVALVSHRTLTHAPVVDR